MATNKKERQEEERRKTLLWWARQSPNPVTRKTARKAIAKKEDKS